MELAASLAGVGLTGGAGCPCVKIRINEDEIMATVHGGDMTIGAQRKAVYRLVRRTGLPCEIKHHMTVARADLATSGRVLKRVITWTCEGIAAPRTAE